MPLFAYICRDCEESMELLIRGQEKPACSNCGSTRLEKQLSRCTPLQSNAPAPMGCGAAQCCGMSQGCSFAQN